MPYNSRSTSTCSSGLTSRPSQARLGQPRVASTGRATGGLRTASSALHIGIALLATSAPPSGVVSRKLPSGRVPIRRRSNSAVSHVVLRKRKGQLAFSSSSSPCSLRAQRTAQYCDVSVLTQSRGDGTLGNLGDEDVRRRVRVDAIFGSGVPSGLPGAPAGRCLLQSSAIGSRIGAQSPRMTTGTDRPS
jgi:hypothetical protein